MVKKVLILLVLVLPLLGAGYFFLYLRGKNIDFTYPLEKTFTKNETDDNMIENPLNGVKYPETERGRIERRPLAVMVGNNYDARPQSSVNQADLVYEVVAEGGITRFVPVFLYNEPEKIGPIRSVRAYFLYWVMELGDALLMHDGWSSSPIQEVSAVHLIDSLHIRSLFRGGLYGWRDSNRFAPNNEYISVKTAREHADKLGWQGTSQLIPWKFKDDAQKTKLAAQSASEINIVFWSTGNYDSDWIYDQEKNLYLKSTGGEPHKDLETGSQLSAKNVIVQFAKETPVNDEKHHLLYDNVGSGKALIFLDGKVVPATWVKKDQRDRTLFFDLDGKEMVFNRGVVWIAVVPDRNEDQVTYK